MSDLVSLSKYLPLTVTNLSHAMSSPHMLFSVLLPSYPVNPLEQTLSSCCPRITQRSRVSKCCWKTSFFSFFKKNIQKSERHSGAAGGHGFYPWKHQLSRGTGCTQLKGQPDLAKWIRAAASARSTVAGGGQLLTLGPLRSQHVTCGKGGFSSPFRKQIKISLDSSC